MSLTPRPSILPSIYEPELSLKSPEFYGRLRKAFSHRQIGPIVEQEYRRQDIVQNKHRRPLQRQHEHRKHDMVPISELVRGTRLTLLKPEAKHITILVLLAHCSRLHHTKGAVQYLTVRQADRLKSLLSSKSTEDAARFALTFCALRDKHFPELRVRQQGRSVAEFLGQFSV